MKQHIWNVHVEEVARPTKVIKVVTKNDDIGEAVSIVKSHLEQTKGTKPCNKRILSVDYSGEVVSGDYTKR